MHIFSGVKWPIDFSFSRKMCSPLADIKKMGMQKGSFLTMFFVTIWNGS